MYAPVRLRPVETEDVERLARVLAHPDLAGRRGLPDDRPGLRSITSLRTAIEQLADSPHSTVRVIQADEVVGLAAAHSWWDAMAPWIHVVVEPERQRRGHGSEAVRLLVSEVFASSPALMVDFSVPDWDAGGLAFADRVGGVEVGRRRRVGIRNGRYFDEVEFMIRRPEAADATAG